MSTIDTGYHMPDDNDYTHNIEFTPYYHQASFGKSFFFLIGGTYSTLRMPFSNGGKLSATVNNISIAIHSGVLLCQ